MTDEGDVWESLRAEALWNPRAWLYNAEALKLAADTLAPIFQNEMHARMQLGKPPSSPLGPPYMLLAGHAIEALLKGLFAARNRDSGADWPRRHLDLELVRLAGEEAPFDGGDERIVKKLSAFVRWAGTYPVPLTAKELAHPPNPMLAPYSYSTGDVIYVDTLYSRYADRLRALAEDAAE